MFRQTDLSFLRLLLRRCVLVAGLFSAFHAFASDTTNEVKGLIYVEEGSELFCRPALESEQ